jgi:hypothetical protein
LVSDERSSTDITRGKIMTENTCNSAKAKAIVTVEPTSLTPTRPSKIDPSIYAPPAPTADSIQALRSAIEKGKVCVVEWYDPRTVTHAPWDMYCKPQHMAPQICLSVGFIYDMPDDQAIYVLPHQVRNPFENDDDWNEGEIVIPYSSIRFINPLTADYATFKCFPDRGAAMDPRRSDAGQSTGDSTR